MQETAKMVGFLHNGSSATRTQVDLTEEQRRLIDRIAAGDGVTMAEVIRRALDVYLHTECDPASAPSATFAERAGRIRCEIGRRPE